MPKLLVANRGEIAVRVLRCAAELGWDTVAIYMPEDESHATFANETVQLGQPSDYVNVDRIVEIAQMTGCTHLHPGYGFLSENPLLPLSLPNSITFIGPSPECLRITSDKILSRNLAIELGINVAPGQEVNSSEKVRLFAHAEGYPLIIKAVDGGGGRGIRIVEAEDMLENAFSRSIGESPSRQVFVEKALLGLGWRHIEIQIIGDGSGNVNHFWERECSVQRRFQKIVEICPSRLNRDFIQPLIDASLKLAKHLRYRGLGTFEYLVNAETHQWVFLEINPRIQVEHTVTEEVMDIDLVRCQLLLFSSNTTLEALLYEKRPNPPQRSAIQLRLTAEEPLRSFSLSTGLISSFGTRWPQGPGVRLDTWLTTGPYAGESPSNWVVGMEFDSLLAKIIVSGRNYQEMSQRAIRAMKELRLRGSVKTNIMVLLGVLAHADWESGRIDTLWLERNIDDICRLGRSGLSLEPALGVRSSRSAQDLGQVESVGASRTITLQPGALFHLTVAENNSADFPGRKHSISLSSITQNGFPQNLAGVLQTTFSPTPLRFMLSQSASVATDSSAFELASPNDPSHIASPFTGKIVQLHPGLSPGPNTAGTHPQRIKRGETLVIMTLMKMENAVVAPHDGILGKAGKGVKVGSVITEGMLLCVLNPATETSRL